MLLFLLDRLPKELISEIALFEGRILRAYLRDYISEIYTQVYKNYFGYRHTLTFICGRVTPGNDRMMSLPFYTAWSAMMRSRHPEFLKKRKPRKHMKTYVGIVPMKRLVQERLVIEANLSRYFRHSYPNTQTIPDFLG